MNKCPRCGTELNNEKFCPNCGLDLQPKPPRKPKNKSMTYLLYVIIFFSFITIPLIYNRYLQSNTSDSSQIKEEDKVELKDVQKTAPSRIVAQYTALADFKKQFHNVDSYVKGIEDYEKKITDKSGFVFDKTYEVSVLDNYNIYYYLTYTAKVSDKLSIKVERNYDRSHTYNTERVTVKKNDVTEFKEFVLNAEELKSLEYFIDNQDIFEKLMDKFSSREEEFKSKKDGLGQYGIGNYQKASSFVAHKRGDTYYSELTYIHEVKEFIS